VLVAHLYRLNFEPRETRSKPTNLRLAVIAPRAETRNGPILAETLVSAARAEYSRSSAGPVHSGLMKTRAALQAPMDLRTLTVEVDVRNSTLWTFERRSAELPEVSCPSDA
jgi:hypothetical protein